jgi:dolichyl-phosphate beta-glucosyltransferase
MNPYLSVIIPAYNEERRITKTLHTIYNYLSKQQYEWEMLIVIDGARDDTLGRVKEFSLDRKNIRWIDRKENKGKGYTVRKGMLAALGEVRLFTDADNSTDITHFDKMKPYFESGYDVIIASRNAKDEASACQAIRQPFYKRLLGNLGNLLIQLVAVPGIWDTQCGFKAFTRTAAESIFSVSQIDGWGFDVEALALSRRFGFRIGIIGVHWVDDAETNVRLVNYLEVLFETLQIRRNMISGIYNRQVNAVRRNDAV